jgi:hypothetical protein
MSLILSGTDGLSDVDGSASTPAIRGTDANTGIFFPAADTIAFAEGGAEVARFDSSGNLGIGITSPVGKLSVYGSGALATFQNSTTGSSGADGSYIALNGNDLQISNKESANMIFYTVDTERMRLNSSGNLTIGASSTVDSERLNVTQSGSFPTIYSNNTNASNAFGIRVNLSNYFFNTANLLYDGIEFSNVRFRVYSNGGIANYQANDQNLSDQREKKNIELAPNYLDKICQIPVKTFLYINQTDTQKTLGVIAQDVQAIAPELVDEADWSENVDGSKMRLSIYQTDLQYALMKAIQELKAIVDAQAIEIAELKAGN